MSSLNTSVADMEHPATADGFLCWNVFHVNESLKASAVLLGGDSKNHDNWLTSGAVKALVT